MDVELTGAVASISIPSLVLESIFDDCDQYDRDETGGRIIGNFRRSASGSLEVAVTGVIDAGPKARRSRSSFFQDGDYQARLFRQIECANPTVEHLGNWHTHHVNGLQTLSGGDIATYRRIVNHEKHNLDFFYALLVVSRRQGGKAASRYIVKHYVLLRGDDAVYEVDPALVFTTEEAPIWPLGLRFGAANADLEGRREVRAKDSAIIRELYPLLRPYWSKRANTLYWKGLLELVNGSSVDVTVPETSPSESCGASCYQVLVKKVPSECAKVYEEFRGREFNSAAQAVCTFERQMNRSLYRAINEQGHE